MSSPVPVLFLLPALPVGGAERQIATLVARLDRARFVPFVATQHGLGPVADEIRAGGVEPEVLSASGRFGPDFIRRVAGHVRRHGIRVILSHGFSTGVAARLAGVFGGAPVRVLAEHSTGERDMSGGRHRINRWLNPLTSAWIALAPGQLPYLTETKGIPRDRIRLIPNGIDPAPFGANEAARARIRSELGIAPEAAVAGMLAVLRPEKDHRTFLLASRFVLDDLPHAHFVIVGDGPLREQLERELPALNLEGHVTFGGRRSDVPAVLSAFDLSVLSSTDVETFPLAFLESMATRLPLVATRVGGLPELVRENENGFLVAPRDPRGLADAMLRILSDAELAARFGRESRRLVETEFHRDRMVAAYEALFAELLAAHGIEVPA